MRFEAGRIRKGSLGTSPGGERADSPSGGTRRKNRTESSRLVVSENCATSTAAAAALNTEEKSTKFSVQQPTSCFFLPCSERQQTPFTALRSRRRLIGLSVLCLGPCFPDSVPARSATQPEEGVEPYNPPLRTHHKEKEPNGHNTHTSRRWK